MGDPTHGMLPFFYLPGLAITAGIIAALAIGIASGILPAVGAMRMRVVEALRRV
jgi:ABC-type antimicrobial peptide transport system permease subunit